MCVACRITVRRSTVLQSHCQRPTSTPSPFFPAMGAGPKKDTDARTQRRTASTAVARLSQLYPRKPWHTESILLRRRRGEATPNKGEA